MNDETWIAVDTETSGLSAPIYVLEIAAQKMRGWEPDGDPFRVLLNHKVDIDPAAVAVHGYTREYLEMHGMDPLKAHEMFYIYASSYPLVAYNLSYDWDRVLYPEYNRLHLPSAGTKGFCALTLARRTISGVENYKLETLKQHFKLNANRPHSGRNDVETLVKLLTDVVKPRLSKGGVVGFDNIKTFSRKTPVCSCLEQINLYADVEPEWFMTTDGTDQTGPLTVKEIKAKMGTEMFYVWRPGMVEWAAKDDVPEFALTISRRKKATRKSKPAKLAPAPTTASEEHAVKSASIQRDLSELLGLCRGILADGIINDQEFLMLRNWLMQSRHQDIYPINVLADKIEQICEDGYFTSAEHQELFEFIVECLNMN